MAGLRAAGGRIVVHMMRPARVEVNRPPGATAVQTWPGWTAWAAGEGRECTISGDITYLVNRDEG